MAFKVHRMHRKSTSPSSSMSRLQQKNQSFLLLFFSFEQNFYIQSRCLFFFFYIHLRSSPHSSSCKGLVIISCELIGDSYVRTWELTTTWSWFFVGVFSLRSSFCHLVSESFARLAWRKAARSLISNTQSLTISVNKEGQRLWSTSPF